VHVQLHASELQWYMEGLDSLSKSFTPSAHCIRPWMGPRTGLDTVAAKRIILAGNPVLYPVPLLAEVTQKSSPSLSNTNESEVMKTY